VEWEGSTLPGRTFSSVYATPLLWDQAQLGLKPALQPFIDPAAHTRLHTSSVKMPVTYRDVNSAFHPFWVDK